MNARVTRQTKRLDISPDNVYSSPNSHTLQSSEYHWHNSNLPMLAMRTPFPKGLKVRPWRDFGSLGEASSFGVWSLKSEQTKDKEVG